MNSVDYSGLNNGPDSYRFDMPNNGGLVCATTILPTTSSDPLTFMQPSIVRDEILSGTVPTIIHRLPPLRSSDQQLDMHEMQTLIGGGCNADSSDLVNEGGAVQVVPNMTMSTAMSEDTISVPSGGGSSLFLEGDEGGSGETLNGSGRGGVCGIGVPVMASTPTKGEQQKLQLRENGRGLAGGGKIEEEAAQLPIVELYQPMMSFTNNNNNPKLVNRNNIGGSGGAVNGNGIPKVQLGRKNGPVYSTVNKKGVHGSGVSNKNGREEEEVEAQPWEKDNLINKRDERLVHENGYAEDDDSRMGLLLNGSAVSNGIDLAENGGGSTNNNKNNNKNTKGGLASNPLWETFRRPIVGPNG